MLGPKEVAGALGVSARTAQRLMRDGETLALRVGRLWRTDQGQLEDWRARQYERYRRPVAQNPQNIPA